MCPAGGAVCSCLRMSPDSAHSGLTQVGVCTDDQLSFPQFGQFEVKRSDPLLLELCVLLVEEFTPKTRLNSSEWPEHPTFHL